MTNANHNKIYYHKTIAINYTNKKKPTTTNQTHLKSHKMMCKTVLMGEYNRMILRVLGRHYSTATLDCWAKRRERRTKSPDRLALSSARRSHTRHRLEKDYRWDDRRGIHPCQFAFCDTFAHKETIPPNGWTRFELPCRREKLFLLLQKWDRAKKKPKPGYSPYFLSGYCYNNRQSLAVCLYGRKKKTTKL